ncbi:MAG: hypothetical protein AB7P03_30620 [Kofleriaceae bacterium]
MRTTLAMLLLAGCWTSSAPRPPRAGSPTPAGPRVPRVAEFGIFEDSGRLRVTRYVPVREGIVFGWRVELPCFDSVAYRERLKLAGAAEWIQDADTTISDDRSTATIESVADCNDGWIEKHWAVSATDPIGPIELTLNVEGFAPVIFRAAYIASRETL